MKKYITKREFLLLVSPPLFNFIVYYLGQAIACDFYHYNFTSHLDSMIPFVPSMIYIYWGCYLFWILNYVLIIKISREGGNRLVLAHFIGETICFLFFVFLPTTMIRPDVSGGGLALKLVEFTYILDTPTNLLPSIHCFVSWLCWIGVRNIKRVPKWYQFISLIMAILVCLATVTVKQHVLIDVVVGIFLAEISYYIGGLILKRACKK